MGTLNNGILGKVVPKNECQSEIIKILDKNTISADKTYKVNSIIVATGSKPKELKGLEFDGKFILNSDDILKLEKLPKSVLIIGSGAIGIEWSRIFSNFGVDVTIVELAEHLVPIADIEVSKRIERTLAVGMKCDRLAEKYNSLLKVCSEF